MRESVPRQVDRESRGPQGERGLEFSKRKKGQSLDSTFCYLKMLIMGVRSLQGCILPEDSVTLRCKLWEWV